MDHRTLCERAETLIGADERGRLTGRSPHLYVLRTPEHVICRCHADLPDRVAATLEQLSQRERGRPSEWSREYADYLNVLSAVAPLREVRAGPLYFVSDALRLESPAIGVSAANADLLLGGLDEWRPDVDAGLPIAAVVREGRAVSICASVKASATAHSAGVETLPDYRGQGLAAQAVAGWARMVASRDATPLLRHDLRQHRLPRGGKSSRPEPGRFGVLG